MFYHIYYETKHISSGNWIVYSTEYYGEEPGETSIIFQNLNSIDAKKACAALRKAFKKGKQKQKIELANRLIKQ